jgi:hypothetical protein
MRFRAARRAGIGPRARQAPARRRGCRAEPSTKTCAALAVTAVEGVGSGEGAQSAPRPSDDLRVPRPHLHCLCDSLRPIRASAASAVLSVGARPLSGFSAPGRPACWRTAGAGGNRSPPTGSPMKRGRRVEVRYMLQKGQASAYVLDADARNCCLSSWVYTSRS